MCHPFVCLQVIVFATVYGVQFSKGDRGDTIIELSHMRN